MTAKSLSAFVIHDAYGVQRCVLGSFLVLLVWHVCTRPARKQKGSSITPWAVVLVTRRRSLMSLHVLHYVTLALRLGMGGLAQGTFGLSPRAYMCHCMQVWACFFLHDHIKTKAQSL